MDTDLQLVLDNDEVKEGTFLYYLREEATFHEEAFWDYYNSVISVTKSTLNKPLDRVITKAVVSTHSKIIESFLWHLTKDDVF